jgi:hypothetical protein
MTENMGGYESRPYGAKRGSGGKAPDALVVAGVPSRLTGLWRPRDCFIRIPSGFAMTRRRFSMTKRSSGKRSVTRVLSGEIALTGRG